MIDDLVAAIMLLVFFTLLWGVWTREGRKWNSHDRTLRGVKRTYGLRTRRKN